MRRSIAFLLVGLADWLYPGSLPTLSNPQLEMHLRKLHGDGDTARPGCW